MADNRRASGGLATARRRPASFLGELLALAGVKSGQSVTDFMMGGGYFTRIQSPAVGAKGKVAANNCAEFIKFRAAYGTEQSTVAGDYKNVTAVTAPLATAGLPGGQDLVLTVQNYHDLHLPPFAPDTADKVNKQIFAALKPGGVYLIVDHAAAASACWSPLETAAVRRCTGSTIALYAARRRSRRRASSWRSRTTRCSATPPTIIRSTSSSRRSAERPTSSASWGAGEAEVGSSARSATWWPSKMLFAASPTDRSAAGGDLLGPGR